MGLGGRFYGGSRGNRFAEKYGVLGFSLEGVIVGNKKELIETCGLLDAQDCIGQFLPTLRIHAVGGLIEDAEAQPAEFLDHRQGQREGEFGLFATREHGKPPIAGSDG